MVALAAHRPARMQRRQQVLLVQVFQDAGRAGRQVVVEQDGAGVEVLQPDAPARAHHGLQGDGVATRQLDHRVLLHFGTDGAHAHIQPGHVEDALQLHQIAQIREVARVVLGNDEQVARLGADLLDRCHGRLDRQRQHRGREVVPASRKQIGVHGRELEPGVADIHRGVERRRVLHPFQPEPPFGGRHGVDDTLFKLVDGPGEGRDKVRNHGCLE